MALLKYSSNYLNQHTAKLLDEELVHKYGFEILQLIEIAGFSVAKAIKKIYTAENFIKILFVCGPGNNGADGLVAARYLKNWGYQIDILAPIVKEQSHNQMLKNLCLKIQCNEIEFNENTEFSSYDLIVDGIFGFGFKLPIKQPYNQILERLKQLKSTPLFSIDVPSGWDINSELNEHVIQPHGLISLSAPKICSQHFRGKFHCVSNFFLPRDLAKSYGIQHFTKINQFLSL